MASRICGDKIQGPSTYLEIVMPMLLERILWTGQSPKESSTRKGGQEMRILPRRLPPRGLQESARHRRR